MDYYATEEQKNLMDYVGKTLVGNMDELYEAWLEILQSDKELKAKNKIKAREWYQRLSEEDRKMLLAIIKRIAFSMVYYLLVDSQDSQAEVIPDALYFAARKDNIVYPNIATESDGLCGDMVADDEGWYESFSKYFELKDRDWYGS